MNPGRVQNSMATKSAVHKLTPKKRPDAPDNRAWYRPFIEQLSEVPNVSAACAYAGISRAAAYKARNDDERFHEAWSDCINASIDHLEEVAFKRAEESSDLLTIFLLKSHRPERYRETNRHEVTGKDEQPFVFTLNLGGSEREGEAPDA